MPRASRFIISHRVYTQRMLLKAEFQPQSPARAPIDRAIEAAGQIILGKETQVRLALACLLARGHLLIEDLPGVGKTTLAHVLAKSLGLQFQRIQFTSDMLPADILGVSIYERDSGGFKFHPGPIFAQVILAAEVNRATPKTQSALLEAMEEHQVTAEGETRKLPEPFYVIATQNPSEQVGTFPLPESQLDRSAAPKPEPKESKKDREAAKDKEGKEKDEEDPQLQKAVELLKSWIIFKDLRPVKRDERVERSM